MCFSNLFGAFLVAPLNFKGRHQALCFAPGSKGTPFLTTRNAENVLVFLRGVPGTGVLVPFYWEGKASKEERSLKKTQPQLRSWVGSSTVGVLMSKPGVKLLSTCFLWPNVGIPFGMLNFEGVPASQKPLPCQRLMLGSSLGINVGMSFSWKWTLWLCNQGSAKT